MDDIDASHGLDCGICYEKYDLTTHLPRILPHCGHTLCSDCLNNLIGSRQTRTFTCPFDKTNIPFRVTSLNQFPPNFQLKTVIEARPAQVYCQEHQKPLDYVCLTHDVRICGDCILLGDHKNSKDHNIQAFNKIKSFYMERKEYLTNVKEEICSFRPDIERLKKVFQDQKDRSKMTIHECFTQIKLFIEYEESKQMRAVDNFFEDRVQDAEVKYIEYQELKEEIEAKVDEVQKRNYLDGPVQTLAEDVWQFSGKLEVLKKTFDQRTSEIFFEDFLEKLELSLATQLSAVYSLKFDTSQIYKDCSVGAEMSSFEQAETLLLQDFDLVIRTLGLNDEYKNEMCLSEIISGPISRSIEALKSLDSICASSENLRVSPPEIMHKLKNVRVFLKNIPELYIWLNHSTDNNINEQTVHDFLQTLFWNPLSVTNIHLRLETLAISDSTIQFLANRIFPRTLNLQYLYIDFDQKNLTSQPIESLLRSLAPISTHLISLELDFSGLSSPHMGNIPCIEFPLPKLKKFKVNFCNTTLNDRSFDAFLRNTVDSLTEVEKFNLDLLNTKVTEQKASELFQKILSVFLKCRKLRFGISITEVSESVVDNFMKQSLTKLEKMEKVSVFGSHGQIQRGFDEIIPIVESESDRELQSARLESLSIDELLAQCCKFEHIDVSDLLQFTKD